MSFGNWLYHKRKYRLFALPAMRFDSSKKKLFALTYERNWELSSNWNVQYFDINSGLTITGKPDMIIEREFNDGKAIYDGLYTREFKKVPRTFWFIDAHLASKQRVRYCDNFDFVFVAHSPYIKYVQQHTSCKNVFWLPLCYPGTTNSITANTAAVKYPVSFIGRYGEGFEKRNEMIAFLKEEYKDQFMAITDYIGTKDLIQASGITTNQSIQNDLNFRVFEVLGYGTPLVTNYVADIDKIEGLQQKLYVFNNFSKLKEHIDMLLADIDNKRNMRAVQDWIKQKHTMKNRLAEMLQMIETGKQVEYK